MVFRAGRSGTGGALVSPLVSVLMNCYNGETYLREAIDSVLAQTYANWEIVFWDNQSKDGSAAIVKSYADPRVKYFYAPEHTNLGEGRNLAAEKATGEWLAFLDCDDLFLPDKLEKQIAIVESDGEGLGLVFGRCYRMEAGRPDTDVTENLVPGEFPEGWILKPLLAWGDFIPLVSAMVRRDAYFAVGGIPTDFKVAEDYYLFAAVAEKYRSRAVQGFCCKARMHANNLTKSTRGLICEESLRILVKWRDQLSPEVYRARVQELQTQIGIDAIVFKKRYAEGLGRILIQGSVGVVVHKALGKLKRKFGIQSPNTGNSV